MTLAKFSKLYFNISLSDMIEVLKCMGLFKSDYTDWKDSMYNEELVKSKDKIINPKELKKRVNEYKKYLSLLLNTKTSVNENCFIKSVLKNKLYSNESLKTFLRGKFIEDE